jgi:hypothetical protein
MWIRTKRNPEFGFFGSPKDTTKALWLSELTDEKNQHKKADILFFST